MLRDVLETKRTGEIDIESARLGAAAMWIIYSGQAILEFLVQDHPRMSFVSGSLYKGPAFEVKRWRFGAKVFEEAVEHIHEEPQKLALRAASLMHTMERNTSH
jgi:ribosomal protein S7